VNVSFSPDTNNNPNPQSVVSTSIVNLAFPQNAATSFANDIALVSLATPFPNVPVPKLLTASPNTPGFPPLNAVLAIVGYGNTGNGLILVAADGRRRVAQTQLGGYLPEQTVTINSNGPQPGDCSTNGLGCILGNSTQPFFVSQFRDPRNPAPPAGFNYFSQTNDPPMLQGGTRQGDSGGPVLWCPNGTPDQCTLSQLVLIGDLSGGNAPQGAQLELYGDISGWNPVNLFASWIAQNNPLRLVTANPGNFNWGNPAAWSDSVLGQTGFFPNNTVVNNQGSAFTQNTARYYDVTLSNLGTITLDMNPTIDTLAIAGAQSQLVLPAGFMLTTVLSTTLSAGTLTMSGGTLISPEFLMSGGMLTGSGTVMAAGGAAGFNTGLCNSGMCVTGGIVAPVGTLSVQGNYTQTGGLLQFQLGPARANGTLAVTNTATLGGTSTLGVTVTPGLYALFTQYTLLTAGAISGTFAQFISSPPPSAFLSLSGPFYDATSVDVRVTRTPFGAVPGLSENQRAVGNALEGAYSTTLTGPAATLFTNLLMTGTPVSLSQLSGEVATGAQQPAFQLMNEFLGIMLDPFVDGRLGVGGLYGGATAFAPDRDPLPEDIALAYSKVLRTPVYKATPFEQRWSVWGAGFGGANRTSGDPLVVGSHDLSAQTAAGAAGLDYRVAPGTIVGFALAGGGTGWSLAQGLGTGSSDTFQAGVYAKTYSGPFYLAGALAYTQHWMSTDRVAFANDLQQARFDAESFGGRAEAGYRIPNTIAAITPYAAVQAQNFHTPTYRETDVTGGGFGLTYNAHDASDTRTELGARFDKPILLNWNAVLALRGRIAWAHDWITDPNLIPTFEVLPGANFLVQGATPAKNSALTSAGAELRLINGFSVLAKFDGEFAAHSQTYAGTGTVRYTW
jgi:outer membrane autotransporter protein